VNDLEKRLHPPLTLLGLRVGIRHGDHDDLISGPVPHILITTPESLDVMLFRGERALSSVRAIVIDEVHLLYNTQRGLQLSILLRRLRQLLPHGLQWAALSATIGDLSYVKDFLMGKNEQADLLVFSANRPIDAQIRHVRNSTDFLYLIHKLTDGQSTKLLIFTNSRRDCELLSGWLQQDESLRDLVVAHYSSLSPEIRVDTERKFASMSTAICVATSTLELGIDIGDIDAVLLWGVPGGVDSFLQRIGRGNRRSEKSNAVCLIPGDVTSIVLKALRFVALIDAARSGKLPICKPYDLFGAIGQQCLSVIAASGGRFTRIADLYELVAHKNYLNRDTLENILAELAFNGFLQRHGYKNRYGAEEALHDLVDMKMIYGNFGIASQTVDIFYGSKRLGDIPTINLMRIRPGFNVRFAGKCWVVHKISRDGIHLQPARPTMDVINIIYGGAGIPSDAYTSDRIWYLLHSSEFPDGLLARSLKPQVLNLCESIQKSCSITQIPYQRTSKGVRYFTFGGYLVNKAIGLISSKVGFEADDISLLVPSIIDWQKIPREPENYEKVFHLIFESSSRQSIYQQNLPLELQQREYIQDWINDITISHILERMTNNEPIQIDNETARLMGYSD
jgi:ATP-dependent Lhr-like helicase